MPALEMSSTSPSLTSLGICCCCDFLSRKIHRPLTINYPRQIWAQLNL